MGFVLFCFGVGGSGAWLVGFFYIYMLSNITELLILEEDKFSLHNYLLNVLKASKEINK